MARFVSQYLKYAHGIRDGVPAHMGLGGKMIPEVTRLEAEFSHDAITPKDAFFAKANLNFSGMPEDEAGHEIDPVYRISVFDSEAARLARGWSVEEEELVVEKLRSANENGSYFVEITPDPIEKPWNNYDETAPDKIVEIAKLVNADLEQVLAYEREHANRLGVIDALQEEAEVEPTEVVRA